MVPPNNCTLPGRLFNPSLVPCGPTNKTNPVVPCCVVGDTCLTGNICQYTHPVKGGSGYYTAGCSNGKNAHGFLNPAEGAVCPNRCGDTKHPDIVYNSKTGLWNCCGATSNGTIECQSPTTEHFIEPAPSALVPYWTAGASALPSTSAASTVPPAAATTTTTTEAPKTTQTTHHSTSTNTPNQPVSSTRAGLSTGAKAGIGIGVAVGVLALLALGWFFLRRRKQKHDPQTPTETQHMGVEHHSPQKVPVEMPGEMEPVELPAPERGTLEAP